MEFRVLGPLEAVHAGEAVSLGGAQQRAVLALLLVCAPEPVSVDRLIDELWEQRPPASAQHAVQVYVSEIRKILRAAGGEVALRTAPAGYVLEVEPERVDAGRFERLIDQARRVGSDDPVRARTMFEQALALWRGPPLAEFGQSERSRREAERLDELHATAIESVVEARLACGEQAEVIGVLTGLVAADPLRERPRWLLMLALYRLGRHAEALAAYRDGRAALDEIGLQPGPELRELEAAILRHDTSLRLPGMPGESGPEVATAGPASQPAPAPPPRTPGEPTANALTPPDPVGSRKARKVVTVLFCDVTGSTALGEGLDPEALHGVMNRYWKELRAAIERHGGTVEKFIGDAVMAVFGIPQVREDDAVRAVRAAAEIRERLPAVAMEVGVALSFRTAVNTGLVLVGDGENLAIGDAVNVAARLEQAAAPGEILLGEATFRLVRDAVQVEPLEPLALKGKSEPVAAFRLLAVDPHAPGLARDMHRPLVGRERELGVLLAGWSRAVEESGCHLFTLLGVAGVGKSRLVAELLAGVSDAATVLSGRCLHYGDGITFWPMLEALAPVGEPARKVLDRLGGGGAATPEELFWEVRRLLESLAHSLPIILHVDDLQWAEPMLLDLLDHIVELSRGAPILLLCTARPELLEDRPAWGGGKLSATTVFLEPLDAGDSELLLDQLGNGLDRDARARVIAASEGNPLFLEEMVALAGERGTFVVPSTIQALLAARLDRLPVGERELLERGAVEGEVFHRTALQALAGEGEATELDLRLAGLLRKELIRSHPPTLEGDEAYRFRHLLLRDSAYDGLPKATRGDLHQRFAGWLEKASAELPELDEIAGWHLEQAVRYARELRGEVDTALAVRAAGHLHAAGRRAGERGDVGAARNLLERALTVAPERSTLAATVGVDLAERLIDIGDLARVDDLLSAAERDPDVADLATLIRFEWMLSAEPQGATRAILARLPRILERFADAGDARGLAKAHMVAFEVHWLAGRATAAGEELRLVADSARRTGDRGMRSRALAQYTLTLIYGPQDAATLARELGAMEEEDLGPYVKAFLDLGRAELQRLEGNVDEARHFARQALDGCGSLGIGAVQGGLEQDLGQIELSFGEPGGALAALLRSDAILARLGERAMRSTTQALLAQAYERLGNPGAARAAIELSDELGAAEDLLNYVITHPVRARLALADGDSAAAERWARSGVEYASRIELVRAAARARLELAGVLSALARREEATAEARAALDLYQAKGDRPGASEARALLDEIGSLT